MKDDAEQTVKLTKTGRKRGLTMAVPRVSKAAIREIIGRLRARNPNLQELKMEDLIKVATTMWVHGWGQSLRSKAFK